MLKASLRKPSRNFGPIVPEAASKLATAELSRLCTGANDLPKRPDPSFSNTSLDLNPFETLQAEGLAFGDQQHQGSLSHEARF